MPFASGIRAGAVFIEITVSDSRLIRGLQSATKRLRAFSKGLHVLGTRMAGVGAAIVGPLLASAKTYASLGVHLDKMSRRTGISVEALSELSYAAQLSEVSLEAVEMAIKRMQRVIADAALGSQAAADALALVGLSAEKLTGLSPEEQFTQIGERLNAIRDPALRAAAAIRIFGRAGTAPLPMFENLSRMRAEARRLGLVLSTEDARAATEFKDTFTRLWLSLKMVAVTLGAALAPLLTELAQRMLRLVPGLRRWLNENKGVVISALKIGSMLVVMGAACIMLGRIFSTLSVLSRVLGLSFLALGKTFSVFLSVVSGAVGFLASPVGLVITTIVALGSILLWVSAAGGKALAWLRARFLELTQVAVESFQGIKDAIAAGDMVLAARIFWLSIRVAWHAGINKLKELWIDFKTWFFQTGNDVFYGLVMILVDIGYDLRKSWIEIINFWTELLNRFTGYFLRTWNRLTGWCAKQWVKVMSLFDPSIQVEAVQRRVEEQTQRQNLEISQRLVEERLAGERELADLEKRRQWTLGAISDELEKEARVRRTQYAVEMKEAEDELMKMKQEWRAAIDEARAKRATLEAAALGAEQPEDLREQLQTLVPELERAFRIDVVGTFSAEAIERMGIGPTAVEERTARATEETAKNTRKITQQLAEGLGLIFE